MGEAYMTKENSPTMKDCFFRRQGKSGQGNGLAINKIILAKVA